MKKVLRSIQTYFPFLHDLRYRIQAVTMRLRNKPVEDDFLLMRHFQPEAGQCFVDVGANRGETILTMMLFKSYQNPIVAFEPNRILCEKFEQRGFHKNPRVEIHNYGLSEKAGEMTLYIPFYRKWMFDGLASFHFEEAANWLRGRFWRFRESNLHIEEMTTEVRTLDSFKLNPYFMKIDVQGHELPVLKGARQTLERSKPILLIEAVEEEVASYLRELGYQCYAYEDGQLKPGFGALNTYCIAEHHREYLPLNNS